MSLAIQKYVKINCYENAERTYCTNMKIIGTTLNAKYIHTNLALRYLKAYAAPEYNVEIVEYTIKDPVMNIVTDLYKRSPDVIGFSLSLIHI